LRLPIDSKPLMLEKPGRKYARRFALEACVREYEPGFAFGTVQDAIHSPSHDDGVIALVAVRRCPSICANEFLLQAFGSDSKRVV